MQRNRDNWNLPISSLQEYLQQRAEITSQEIDLADDPKPLFQGPPMCMKSQRTMEKDRFSGTQIHIDGTQWLLNTSKATMGLFIFTNIMSGYQCSTEIERPGHSHWDELYQRVNPKHASAVVSPAEFLILRCITPGTT